MTFAVETCAKVDGTHKNTLSRFVLSTAELSSPTLAHCAIAVPPSHGRTSAHRFMTHSPAKVVMLYNILQTNIR